MICKSRIFQICLNSTSLTFIFCSLWVKIRLNIVYLSTCKVRIKITNKSERNITKPFETKWNHLKQTVKVWWFKILLQWPKWFFLLLCSHNWFLILFNFVSFPFLVSFQLVSFCFVQFRFFSNSLRTLQVPCIFCIHLHVLKLINDSFTKFCSPAHTIHPSCWRGHACGATPGEDQTIPVHTDGLKC